MFYFTNEDCINDETLPVLGVWYYPCPPDVFSKLHFSRIHLFQSQTKFSLLYLKNTQRINSINSTQLSEVLLLSNQLAFTNCYSMLCHIRVMASVPGLNIPSCSLFWLWKPSIKEVNVLFLLSDFHAMTLAAVINVHVQVSSFTTSARSSSFPQESVFVFMIILFSSGRNARILLFLSR